MYGEQKSNLRGSSPKERMEFSSGLLKLRKQNTRSRKYIQGKRREQLKTGGKSSTWYRVTTESPDGSVVQS